METFNATEARKIARSASSVNSILEDILRASQYGYCKLEMKGKAGLSEVDKTTLVRMGFRMKYSLMGNLECIMW